ncbi:acyl carrier protein phosphodiesterase [Thermoflavifilum thermophilum]|nr:ACP phosphodiesterase [Thermoflavifilum thermophilum]
MINSQMNFLAHAYLSFYNPPLLVGNMIADFVKGKKSLNRFPEAIQAGIVLHRAIDEFTDTHPVTHQVRDMFRLHYGLCAALFADVIYDYFLANDSRIFNKHSLQTFAQYTYQTLHAYRQWWPDDFDRVFMYMETQNWLWNYRTESGLFRSMESLIRRFHLAQGIQPAMDDFHTHYEKLQGCYQRFFPALQSFVRNFHPLHA